MNANATFRKILVATDFSDHADAAVAQAVWLAKRLGAAVTIVHVISFTDESMTSLAIYPWYMTPDLDAIEKRLQAAAEVHLRETIALHRPTSVKLSYRILRGTPFVEIIRLAEREAFDLVVVGTRGLSAVPRLLVGSTAGKLVRKCPVPVWTVPSRPENRTNIILAPVDFAEVSRKSVTLAAQLAAATSGALHVLHVYPADDAYALQLLRETEELEIAIKRRLQRRQTIELLRKFVDDLKLPVEPTLHVERGEPWRCILSTARRIGADVTIMGTLGRGGIPGMLMGNTAEKVLHSSAGALLAVKPEGFVSPVASQLAPGQPVLSQ